MFHFLGFTLIHVLASSLTEAKWLWWFQYNIHVLHHPEGKDRLETFLLLNLKQTHNLQSDLDKPERIKVAKVHHALIISLGLGYHLVFPGSSAGKQSACNAGDPSSIAGFGRSPGEGIGYPRQYSWTSLVAQLVKNPPAVQRPGFDLWVGKIPWRTERLPTPVFWPGEFHRLYGPWGHKESDTTEWLHLDQHLGKEDGIKLTG